MGKGVVTGLEDFRDAADPIELFSEWFDSAKESGIFLPEAMTLSTATPDGTPSSRQVLLKGYSADGFEFYTNYDSRKAAELDANPRASLLFHWAVLERQVRIEGTVKRMEKFESETYFKTRPRGSQIGAWASAQSSKLPARDELARHVDDIEKRFAGKDIPLPPNWGGYRLSQSRLEFWQGRLNRLHDRLVFESTDNGWNSHRLYP